MSDSTPARPRRRLPVVRPSPARGDRRCRPGALGGLTAELRRHVDAAAGLVGSSADGAAIATAIEARRDWDDATVDALQREALDAGGALRRLAAAAAAESGDDD